MPELRKPAADKAHGLHKGDQLGGAIDQIIQQGIARAQDGQAVYFGERLIGFLIGRRSGFDALTANGKSLGRFNSEVAAARALLAEAGAAK